MEWLVFTGLVVWLTSVAILWLRLSAVERRLRDLVEETSVPGRAAPAGVALSEPEPGSHPKALAPSALGGTAAVPTALNFSRRVQVLRLHRRGESLSHIAALVGVSAAEAELTIKLHAQGLSAVNES